ncbi:MAG: hypothetical protein ACJA0H_001292, partial [Francisellaceae bacterium]
LAVKSLPKFIMRHTHLLKVVVGCFDINLVEVSGSI